jgi:hypothetical protein
MDDKEKAIRQRLKDDFVHYAAKCLKIRLKAPKLNTTTNKYESVAPFVLNKAQRYIHDRLEAQIADTGKVRALILKGRQQGCSTYVEGRFYWKVTHHKGVRAYILTHEDDATRNLFEMANRYYDNCPEIVRPQKDSSNAKELDFGLLDSGYRVGTAGNKSAGRSGTIQFFHGSEVGYWPNAEEHAAGALQTVPNQSGSEIILESTANGLGNYFHRQWQKAESGSGDFIAIFVPWFWQDEYISKVDASFRLDDLDTEYKEAYGLTNEQMAWRANKIAELGEWKFKQEYPATAAEAFLTNADAVYIEPELVLRARKSSAAPVGAKVIGVDPAHEGEDRTAIAIRHGRACTRIITYQGKDTMEVASIVVKLIKEEEPQRVFLDKGGIGAGIYDRLKEMGYSNVVTGVNFGESPLDKERYFNKRTEMWGEMREWLKDNPVKIPDSDELHADLTAPIYEKDDSLSRPRFFSKQYLRSHGIRSPDLADALALTFAFPVRETPPKVYTPPAFSDSGWMNI